MILEAGNQEPEWVEIQDSRFKFSDQKQPLKQRRKQHKDRKLILDEHCKS
jgi:hypothetical protein